MNKNRCDKNSLRDINKYNEFYFGEIIDRLVLIA